MKFHGLDQIFSVNRPTPCGVGGLKYDVAAKVVEYPQSHPVRGGWIEIAYLRRRPCIRARPTPCGVGGLKSRHSGRGVNVQRRPTPCGVGGLKFREARRGLHPTPSHPVRGGWIDMTARSSGLHCHFWSHPVRGGWIEIENATNFSRVTKVPPRAGWVD